MIWQDAVISVGQFVFALAMIPTIRSSSKPALASSVVTAIGLTVFALTFSTLDLWLSVAGTATGALTWWIVAAQTYTRSRVGWRYFSGRPPERQHIVLPRNKLTLSTDVRMCECLLECDGVASLIDGEICRANVKRRWREQYGSPVPSDEELLKGTATMLEPRGILNVCLKGFDRDCGLPSGHDGDCITASKLDEHVHGVAVHSHTGREPGHEHRCHADRDGDCNWFACPQEYNSRANYQTTCPFAVRSEEL